MRDHTTILGIAGVCVKTPIIVQPYARHKTLSAKGRRFQWTNHK